MAENMIVTGTEPPPVDDAASPPLVVRHTCGRCRDKVAVPGYRLCMKCLMGSAAPTATHFVGKPSTGAPLPPVVRERKVRP